jgi:tRNA threonylcarbamoyladenosine modification (KEOPS) complex  Pcc1 subunit
MKAKATLEMIFPSEIALDAAALAVSHEGGLSERSKASLTKKGNSLIITIEAKDIVALRSTTNAYLRALQAIEGVEADEE